MKSVLKIVLAGTLAALAISRAPLRAEDWSTVLGEAQRRCEAQHAAIQDMTIVQDMVTHTPEGDLTAEQRIYQRGPMARVEMTMDLPPDAGLDSLTTIVIDTGTERWEISPLAGKRRLTDSAAVLEAAPHQCWDFTRENSRLVGEGTAQERAAHMVELTRDGVTHTLWLDKETLQVLEGRSQSGPDTVRWVLSDFRPVHGDYRHPYKVEIFDGDQLISTMNVRSLVVNTGLADSVFDPEQVSVPTINMEELLQQMFQGGGGEFYEDSLAPEDTTR